MTHRDQVALVAKLAGRGVLRGNHHAMLQGVKQPGVGGSHRLPEGRRGDGGEGQGCKRRDVLRRGSGDLCCPQPPPRAV